MRWDLTLKDNILIKLSKNFSKDSLDNAYKFTKENNLNKFNVIDLRVSDQIIVYE